MKGIATTIPNDLTKPRFDGISVVSIPPLALSTPPKLSIAGRCLLVEGYRDLYQEFQNLDEVTRFQNGSQERLEEASRIYIDSRKSRLEKVQESLLQSSNVIVSETSYAGIEVYLIGRPGRNAIADSNSLILHFNDTNSLLGYESLIAPILTTKNSGISTIVPRRENYSKKYSKQELLKMLALYEAVTSQNEEGKIALTGEVRGALVCAALSVLIYQRNLPTPQALGLIGIKDMIGDSFYQNRFLDITNLEQAQNVELDSYVNGVNGNCDYPDPVLSPIHSNMNIFPPSILFSGTRDVNFSATVQYHRKLKRSNVPADLHVYNGLTQYYHLYPELNEASQTYALLSRFLEKNLLNSY